MKPKFSDAHLCDFLRSLINLPLFSYFSVQSHKLLFFKLFLHPNENNWTNANWSIMTHDYVLIYLFLFPYSKLSYTMSIMDYKHVFWPLGSASFRCGYMSETWNLCFLYIYDPYRLYNANNFLVFVFFKLFFSYRQQLLNNL